MDSPTFLDRHAEVLLSRIIPRPHTFSLVSASLYRLEEGCVLLLTIPPGCDEAARRMIEEESREYWGIQPATSVSTSACTLPAEGYRIECSTDVLRITVSGLAGLRHALRTLRQLAEPERGVLKYTHYVLPCVRIEDAPASSFRGIHLCWFPETPAWEMEKQIRLAAYYKFNYVVIESWGVLQFASHPECGWQEKSVTPEEFRRLVRLGKALGVVLIPQLNIFGHASGARCGSGKHMLLDFHPEYQSLFEPDGWSWCISNPATRAYLTDLIREMLDIFDHPPYFHIGCDEAYNAGLCASCRDQDYGVILKEYICHFRDLLAAEGARAMMWHDMLLDQADPRWRGYVVSGDMRTEALYRELPRDILICYWQYGYPGTDGQPPAWEPVLFLRDTGFDVLVCPWVDRRTTQSYGNLVASERLAGMLATTWNINHSKNMYSIFYEAANAIWNPSGQAAADIVTREYFNHHVRQIGWDMKVTHYEQTGSAQHQINPHDHEHP